MEFHGLSWIPWNGNENREEDKDKHGEDEAEKKEQGGEKQKRRGAETPKKVEGDHGCGEAC